MENYSVYEDVASRTNGAFYIGVVGPVRTGKSTFIKRFMEKLVLPSVEETKKGRMTDELPQSASGKTVMTTEPKFVPNEEAKICIANGCEVAVRLVDCVGFAVEGASGFTEEDRPRLVKTPWKEEPMPFLEAAALGTEKVIKEHSTIGVLVTTDGTVTDIPRGNYVEAEERTVAELKKIGKPFVILLNCKNPASSQTLRFELEEKYAVPVIAMNAEEMEEKEICALLQRVLFEFPLLQLDVKIPSWLQALPMENETVGKLLCVLRENAPSLQKMKDCLGLEKLFDDGDIFTNLEGVKMDLGKGRAEIYVDVKEEAFYQTISAACGEEIVGKKQLMQYAIALAESKKNYDKIKDAFESAKENGYGVVLPSGEEMSLEKPKLMKKGAGYGVKFRASAKSYHVLRVDVNGEVSPIIGLKEQGESFLQSTLEAYQEDESKVWETNIFGKTLRTLADDELCKKTEAMPTELKRKMRNTVSRIVNEGKGGVICILL